MKKFLAIVLMLCIAAFTFTAMAEARSYVFVAMTDAEDNEVEIPEEEFPIIALQLDDEANTFSFFSSLTETEITGTVAFETVEDEDGAYVVLTLTAEDGDVQEAILYVDEESGIDYVIMFDADNNSYYMMNSAYITEEEAA